MTYLDWGCEPLREECQSCLDALCSACQEDFKKRSRPVEDPDGLEVPGQDVMEPDCDRCDIGRKPGCAHCTIIYDICRDCADNARCEFRITGLPEEDRKKN
jgi:hypothetical protein